MVDKIEQNVPSEAQNVNSAEVQLIDVRMDKYKGVIIKNMELLAKSEQEFDAQLAASLQHWKSQGARSIQIFFRPPYCHLINSAANHGFYFHHAHKDENYVLMCKWVDETTGDRLPAYADHYVGVGGIMVNEHNQVLMIQQRRVSGSGNFRPWKFPGGYVDRGETIKQAVEREVLEETGVKGQFQGVLALREEMEHKYGAADFYIVSILSPDPTNQTVDIQDIQEVHNAKWISISEITSNDENSKYRMTTTAYEFFKLVKEWLIMNGRIKGFGSDAEAANQDLPRDDLKIDDLMKIPTLSHRSQVGWNSRENREMLWNFYMPYTVDKEIQKNE